jgi:hypothetical protein
MAEALLRHAAIPTLNLGPAIPMDQIVTAVGGTGVATLALSFGSCSDRSRR